MAKKTVAGYRDKSKAKGFTKVVVAVKNEKTGTYTYREEIVPTDNVDAFLKDSK
ncbi:MAG: DUF4295 family protein [Bacteroidia bacterium]